MKPIPLRWRLPLCALLLLPLQAQTQSESVDEEARAVAPVDWLLEQLRLGEARHNEVLVEQTLERLALLAPNDPRVLQARVRKALRKKKLDDAGELVERLAEEAPESDAYRLARLELELAGARLDDLLTARLMATTGRVEEAKAAYDDLFSEGFPTLPLALEYWQLVARLPEGEARAIEALQDLDERYPRSPELRFALARLLFGAGRHEDAFDRLEQLGEDPGTRRAAARQWRDALRGEPPSEASVAGWQRFLRVFGDTDYASEAQEILARQQERLADPNFQLRRRGLALHEDAGGTAGEAEIQRALEVYPEDVELIGALGVIRLRQARYEEALDLLRRAEELDDSPYTGGKWEARIATATYWQQIKRGDEALAAGDDQTAFDAFSLAREQTEAANEAWLGLGDVARLRHQEAAAERAYREALRINPNYTTALERLVALYAQRSPRQAIDFIDGLSPSRQAALGDTRAQLRIAMLQEESEALLAQGEDAKAIERLIEARRINPDDVWLSYTLANLLAKRDRRPEADRVFQDLLANLTAPEERAQGRYAQALYLSGDNRDAQALDALRRIPEDQRNAETGRLRSRLERGLLLARAEERRARGDETGAVALLEAAPADGGISRRLGDWAQERGEPAVAEAYYRQALDLEPDSPSARLGLVETALAQGDEAGARERLEAFSPAPTDFAARRRQIDLWSALGETDRAETMMEALLAEEAAGKDPLILRSAGQLAEAQGQRERALDRYRRAMVAADLSDPESLEDAATLTRLTRPSEADDWLAASLRDRVAETYQAGNTRVRYGHLFEHEGGTPGVSELTANTDMLEIDMPLARGRGLVRIDRVALDAGRLDRGPDGLSRESLGTCALGGCAGDFDQEQTGVSVGLGWYNETWRVDIGTTPIGFEVTDIVGGLKYNGDIGPLWFDAVLSRRALDDSLLAYAGVEDPRSGDTWGGVRANGVSLGLGYDRGGPWGVWSKWGAHFLEGENVEDNTRLQAMGGVYRKLINRRNERLSVGVNALYMHYDKELGGYTYGQGGYYSPQQYFSLSLPVSYARRSANWSWEVGASISQSWSDSDDSPRYPKGVSGAALEEADRRRRGGSGGDFGYGLNGRVERRLSNHWALGLGFALQEAEDYSPDMFGLTLRYTLDPWQGSLDMPPMELVPYAEFD
ncbi:cellulose synthase complex outer membrane protein BcsC [Pistricoccus aurantiacus]|uniref:cellulose synthase complex outer membrane protein BcsC n=1 Tax=Pistricoccus aurantiacus TaxID=1883414 RepID=UPI00362770C6